ncbi:MAG: hypothetical protein ACKOI2_00810 [Actinomycetota bacterium]
MGQTLAPVIPAGAVTPSRHLRIGRTSYPVVLPRLRDSRLHVAAVVITLHTLGQVGLGFHVSVPQILAAVLTCALLQVAITFREMKAFVWPASAMLTGSGIALIMRVPSTPVGDHFTFHKWWMFSAVAALSLLTKFVVRRNGSHVFNPSNIGLVIAFIVLGSSQVEPLDFWWAPLSNPSMVVAYAVILIGGSLIAHRLRLLATVVSFWVVLAAGTGVSAASGSCFTERWAFAPVCGMDLWLTIVTSPEIFIFTYFMITDPRTVPAGRAGRAVFGALVGIVCVVLMAPQETEFGAKVALLAGLTVMTALRQLLERFLPAPGGSDDTLRTVARRVLDGPLASAGLARTKRRVILALGSVTVVVALSVGGQSTSSLLAGEPENLIGRLATRIDPATFPSITVDREVTDWNHEVDADGARAVVLTLAENLALEAQALSQRDEQLLTAIAHGDRLDALRARLEDAETTGSVMTSSYSIDTVRVTLLVPFGRQDGLSLGMMSSGTVRSETRDAHGTIVATSSAPFETMWAVRRATGERWLIVDELPVPSSP